MPGGHHSFPGIISFYYAQVALIIDQLGEPEEWV